MAQPLARDEQGNIWDISNPAAPKFVSHAPLTSPTLPYEGPQAAANLTRTNIEVKNAEATSAATTAKANADAKSAKIAADTAEELWNINHPGSSPTATLSGPQYMHFLQTTNPGRAAYIQGLAEGRVPFPGAQMMRSAAGQALLTDVMRADPTIDATNYTTRAAARKNAATGTLGASDNALITAVGHAARLQTLVPDVYGTSVTPLNSLANFAEGHFAAGRQPAYDQNAQLLGNEVAAAYGTNSQGKQNEAGAEFSSSLATKQKLDNIHGAMDLLGSRLAANRAQFVYGNGQLAKPDFMLLPAQTRQELMTIAPDVAQKYFAGVPSIGGGPTPGNPPPGPGALSPPGGPTGGSLGPSTDGFNNTPDPQSAVFWNGAIQQKIPYDDAIRQWKSQLGGKTVVAPPDPALYNKWLDYVGKHPGVEANPVESFTRTQLSPTAAMMNNVAQSPAATFGVNYFNSLGANVPLSLMGDQGARYQAVSSAQNPKSAMAGNVLGTIGGAVGASKGLDAAIGAGKELPLLGPYLKAMGLTGEDATKVALRRGLTADNLYGATSGAAQDPNNPAAGAALGMAAMTGGNAAGRYVLGPAIRGVQKGINAGAGMFGGQPFDIAPPLDTGQKAIFGQANPAIDTIRAKLSQAADLGLPYALGDSDSRLQALVGSAVRKSPDVASLAQNTLAPRQLGQAERAINLIDTHLAPSGDLASIQADARTRAQTAAAPLYQKAMGAPVPQDAKLNEMLDTPAGQAAARNAYGIALNSGENPAELSFASGSEGPVINATPNWKTLQYVKMGLDKVISDNQNPVTGKLDLTDPGNRALNELRARFVNRLGDLNPDYRDANAAYSKMISQGSAAERGYNATAPKVTPDQAAIALANQGDNASHFQQGYASSMADAVNNAQLSGNPYSRVYGTPNQQAKVNAIFPNADQFGHAYNLENDMAATTREALYGSQTAPRLEADRHFAEGNLLSTGADVAMSTALGIPPIYALRRGAGFLARDMFRLGIGQGAKAKADAIAPILLNTDPMAGLQSLDDLQKQALLRRAYMNQTGAMGGMFGAPAIYGASQQ